MKIKNILFENEQLKKQVVSLEAQLAKKIEESNRLYGELQDIKHLSVWEFANLYCNEEKHAEAGHALAKDLLGR